MVEMVPAPLVTVAYSCISTGTEMITQLGTIAIKLAGVG